MINMEVKTMATDKVIKQKYFTLEEANRALVLVSRIVRDIQLQFEIVTKLRQGIKELAELSQDATYVEVCNAKRELKQLEHDRAMFEAGMDILNEFIDELADVGCQLTDFEEGQVLFLGVHKGKHVEFRWRLGDKRIRGYTAEGSNHLRRLP